MEAFMKYSTLVFLQAMNYLSQINQKHSLNEASMSVCNVFEVHERMSLLVFMEVRRLGMDVWGAANWPCGAITGAGSLKWKQGRSRHLPRRSRGHFEARETDI